MRRNAPFRCLPLNCLSTWQPGRIRGGMEYHAQLRIGADRLVPVSACGDGGGAIFELFGEKRIELPLLAYTRTSFLGRVAGPLHARLEAHTDVVLHFETALVEALKAEVLLGEGVAWLPESMVGVELQSGKLCRSCRRCSQPHHGNFCSGRTTGIVCRSPRFSREI